MRLSRGSRRALAVGATVGLAVLLAAPVSARSNPRQARAADVSPAVSEVGPNIIGFESDATGGKPDGFASVDNPTVHFVDTVGANLSINDFSPATNGDALIVNSDGDLSGLVILFDVPTKRLSILIGNDDPGFSQAGDRVTLEVFRNGKRIARRHVTMNRNDVADQTIEYRGKVAIDRATIIYNRDGVPLGLTEDLDDFEVSQVCTISGNRRANRLNGNAGPNGICGRNGRDTIRGHGGNDVLFGGGGADIVNGHGGNDLIAGGAGNDTLIAADGVPGNDAVYGGPGTDTCTADANDLLVGCENAVVVPTRD